MPSRSASKSSFVVHLLSQCEPEICPPDAPLSAVVELPQQHGTLLKGEVLRL